VVLSNRWIVERLFGWLEVIVCCGEIVNRKFPTLYKPQNQHSFLCYCGYIKQALRKNRSKKEGMWINAGNNTAAYPSKTFKCKHNI